jgi:hypothetical protein
MHQLYISATICGSIEIQEVSNGEFSNICCEENWKLINCLPGAEYAYYPCWSNSLPGDNFSLYKCVLYIIVIISYT